MKGEAPDLVLLDIKLPGMDGYEVLEKALKIDPGIVPIMITAYEDVERVVKAMRLGAFDYITKPFDFDKVRLSIQKALEASQLKREVKHLRREQKNWFGFEQHRRGKSGDEKSPSDDGKIGPKRYRNGFDSRGERNGKGTHCPCHP